MRPKTRCYRGQIPGGGKAFSGKAAISPDIKQSILQIDKDLELHDFGPSGVHLYRVKNRGPAPSSDFLVHQFALKYDPGSWLIQCLKECDMWTRYGSPQRSVRKQLEQYEAPMDKFEREALLRVNEISEAIAPDIIKYIEKQRRNFHLGTVGSSYKRSPRVKGRGRKVFYL